MDKTRRKMLGFMSLMGFASLNLVSFVTPVLAGTDNNGYVTGYMDDAFDPDGWL